VVAGLWTGRGSIPSAARHPSKSFETGWRHAAADSSPPQDAEKWKMEGCSHFSKAGSTTRDAAGPPGAGGVEPAVGRWGEHSARRLLGPRCRGTGGLRLTRAKTMGDGSKKRRTLGRSIARAEPLDDFEAGGGRLEPAGRSCDH